jgi:ribosomal protein S27E
MAKDPDSATAALVPAAAQQWKCEACSGEQHYDAATKMLRCQFCGATRKVPGGKGAIVEHDLFAGIDAMAQGLGTETDKISRCKECGATMHFGDSKIATSCAFCGAAAVWVEATKKIVRPESLVPFGIDNKVANQSFARWIGKLWFRPSDLKKLAKVQEMIGVYVPFWTYDAHVESSWTADAGYYYTVTEDYEVVVNGESETRTREVQHTRWESAWGQRSDDYDDILVCGSVGLPKDLADSLKSFDTQQLVPYTPEYLAGWRAEEYAVDLQAGFEVAKERIDEDQRSRCGGDVPGDTHRMLEVSSTYSQLTFKHVLLPIWIAAYRYRGDVYRILVNGQTGEVQGKAPYSWAKIALLALFVAALLAVFVLFMTKGGGTQSD